jgi:bacterioferritin-associated ferredoxin
VLSDLGYAPTYNDVTGQFKYLRVYLQKQADVGKTVTLYGNDEYGQVIRTVDANGIVQEGVTLTLAKPFVGTSMRFQGSPTRVRKDRTAGPITLWEYDAETDKIRDLAVYQPRETEPMYRRQKLLVSAGAGNSCGGCQTVVRALVKETFVPVELDTDIVQIAEWENLEAIKLMIQSKIEMDSKNKTGADALEMASIRELNLWDRNQQPEETFVVSTNIMGESWRSGRAGRII